LDSQDLTLVSLFIHVPFVTAWIGFVMFDIFAALAPGLTPAQRGRFIAWSRWFVVLAIIVIMITGVWQTMKNPFIEVNSFATLEQLRERTYGFALFLKHGAVLATFGLTIITRFFLAPRLAAVPVGAASGETPATQRLGQLVLGASILNIIACLAALIFTTRMVWTQH
jgi:putative copper export protein